MTSLLPPSTSGPRGDSAPAPRRSSGEVGRDLLTAPPLVAVATVGGVMAALGPLMVALALGVVGWFLSDGGAHGTPSDGLRVGALGWLLGHGSGVRVEGVPITAVPLGVTALAAYVVWRSGHRVGAAISGHGPDAAGLEDGERDWTVPTTVGLFTAGYVVVAVLTATLASTPGTAPSTPAVVGWSVALCLVVGGTAIAIGSGRAAIWAPVVPPLLRTSARVCRRILATWLLVALVALLGSLLLDLSTAANVLSQLHTDPGAIALIVLATLLVLPNAVAFSAAYLTGPGFTVGTGTLVTPGAVVLGPLPMFPVLAALPDEGQTPGWTPWLVLLAPLVAMLATMTVQRRLPTTAWDEGALRGLVGGVGAGLLTGVLAALAGGAVGPGRLAEVGPLAGLVTLHAVVALGLGGVLGGLVATWWQRRAERVALEPDPETDDHTGSEDHHDSDAGTDGAGDDDSEAVAGTRSP